MCTDADLNRLTLDTNFQKLHRQLNTFNIFKATGITDWEIKHTQFLGYLLDPHESHGLREDFLFRFIQAASFNQESLIPISNLNLAQARVFKEKTTNIANGQRIDLLLEIPTLSTPTKYHVLAIENKIQSAQREGQLASYYKDICESNIEAVTGKTFLYLTVSGEEPDCEHWQGITYTDVVLPTVKGLLEDNRDRISEYLIYIFNDYLEFIGDLQDQDSEPPFERTVRSIPEELIRIARALANSSHPVTVSISAAKTRYKKALNYLKSYDNDLRTEILRRYNAITQSKDFPFQREHSIRSHLRFSFLSNEAREKMHKICANPTKPWLEFPNHLAIELEIKENGNENQNELRCSSILTLGPTGTSFVPHRSDLVNKLRRICALNENNRIAPHFTRITPRAFANNEANIVTNADDGVKWINKTIEKIKSPENMDLIDRINECIVNFKTKKENATDLDF